MDWWLRVASGYTAVFFLPLAAMMIKWECFGTSFDSEFRTMYIGRCVPCECQGLSCMMIGIVLADKCALASCGHSAADHDNFHHFWFDWIAPRPWSAPGPVWITSQQGSRHLCDSAFNVFSNYAIFCKFPVIPGEHHRDLMARDVSELDARPLAFPLLGSVCLCYVDKSPCGYTA